MFNRPELKDITVDYLHAAEVEYFCQTRIIDEMIITRKGQKFDPELADKMAEHARFYFVVKKNRQYDVVPGTVFEPWMEKNGFNPVQEQTAKAKACIEHYIQKLKK